MRNINDVIGDGWSGTAGEGGISIWYGSVGVLRRSTDLATSPPSDATIRVGWLEIKSGPLNAYCVAPRAPQLAAALVILAATWSMNWPYRRNA